MAKILAFTGSNNSQSMNKKLLEYSASLIENHEIEMVDLRGIEVPIFGIDLEKEKGIPESIKNLREKFLSCDACEHISWA